jgi:hypothetical protein
MGSYFNELIRATILLSIGLVIATKAVEKDGANGKKLCLAKDHKTAYVIMVSPEDSVANRAAIELAEHLKAVTGVNFPIVRPGRLGVPVIAVGPGVATTLAPGLDVTFAKLRDDGIIIQTVGSNLVLTGAQGAKRGTLYAVYEFLETTVGCRWWTANASYIPHSPNLTIPEQNRVYIPKLQYRDIYYRQTDEIFTARCKNHGPNIVGWCHTFNQLLPPAKYFKAHPEWYSEINGVRTPDAQLCLSNDAMRLELTKNALGWLRKTPAADMISISQNDCFGSCQCSTCRLWVTDGTGRSDPSPSASLIKFVNLVAEDVEKEFPKIYVETIAYQYTRTPPRYLKPRKNVAIRLCNDTGSFSQPLADGQHNEKFRKEIKEWSAISHQLLIWDYVANFANYIQPHPNWHVLAPNIRFFEAHKAISLFEQGDIFSSSGNFVELRFWLLTHLAWNSSLEEQSLIKEFMDAYYGPASRPLRDYIELTCRAVQSSETILLMATPNITWLDLDGLSQATKLFDEAEALVKDDPVLRLRVQKERISVDYVWINQYELMKFMAAAQKKPFSGPPDMAAFCGEFIKRAHALGIERVSEGKTFNDLEQSLIPRFKVTPSLPSRCVGLKDGQWLDVQDYSFNLYGTTVKDDNASDRIATKMKGNTEAWMIQYPLHPILKSMHGYAVVRCEIKPGAAKNGSTFSAGYYGGQHVGGAETGAKSVLVGDVVDGKYHVYDLGVCTIPGGWLWMAPTRNPDLDAVYVDRIFFVKETP